MDSKLWWKIALTSFGILLVTCASVIRLRTKIPNKNSTVVSASPTQGDLCTKPYSCTGCSQVRICRHTASGLRESFRFSCSGTTPYCDEDSGTCTAMPTQDCADTGVLTCMQDGLFPDLINPKTYHVCQNGTSHSFSCQTGYFDGKGCNASIYNYIPFSCSGTSGIKVKHYLDNTVFAYCVNSKVLFVDRCPKDHRLYSRFQECLPVCTGPDQLIADPSDNNKYYLCSKASYELDYTLKSHDCAVGERFDSSCSCCATGCSCGSTGRSSCTCSNCSC